MILLTGATGFVGRALLPHLAESRLETKCLIRPARRTPHLPRGVPVQVSIASLNDGRALRSAMVGVDTVVHLAGAEWLGPRGDLLAVDVTGTRNLLEAAQEAGVSRFIYLSHLGADRASAYPVLKAKGIVEEFIRQSGLPYLILRSTLAVGPEDRFLNGLATMLKSSLIAFNLGDGHTLTQPIWIDDLVTCVAWSVTDSTLLNQTVSVGGPEFFSVTQLLELLLDKLNLNRTILSLHPLAWRASAWFNEQTFPRALIPSRLLDHLAVNRVCELTSLTRYFGLKPTRLITATDYLREKRWWAEVGRLVAWR